MLRDRERAEYGKAFDDLLNGEIGHVLAASPPGTDDIWPAEAVRTIIENIGSRHVVNGIPWASSPRPA